MKQLITVFALLFAAAAQSDERILSFHSDIRVYTDGMVEVTDRKSVV